jgi:hypothetical protein
MNTRTNRQVLRDLDENQLVALYADADDALREAILAECDRRDRVSRQPETDDWALWAHAQYLLASEACAGTGLVTRDGPAGLDGIGMWRGPVHIVLPYATPELKDFWLAHPRLTPTQYRAERAREARLERESAKVTSCILCGHPFKGPQLRQTCRVRSACGKRQSIDQEGPGE